MRTFLTHPGAVAALLILSWAATLPLAALVK
jgi:hypothetical protein